MYLSSKFQSKQAITSEVIIISNKQSYSIMTKLVSVFFSPSPSGGGGGEDLTLYFYESSFNLLSNDVCWPLMKCGLKVLDHGQ